MELQINGNVYQADDNINVEKLLAELGLEPQRVVVEVNHRILTADQHPQVCLKQNDRLEIVQFVGGG